MSLPLKTFSSHGNTIHFYPQRGGIITSLMIKETELLYQDMLEETLLDPEKSVRAGIPVLFPQAGALTKVEQQKLGYTSPQHGIIRNIPFEYKIFDDRVELTYKNTAGAIPYDFDLKLIYTLNETTLKIEYRVENHSQSDFSIAPGFHPYFAVKNKDNVIWQENYAHGIIEDKDNWKQNGTYRFKAPKNSFSFEVPTTGKITISYDEYIKNFWIWSISNKDFICVEPVAGNEGTILKNPIIVPAGKDIGGYIEITVEKHNDRTKNCNYLGK